jgi:hypothetical protein
VNNKMHMENSKKSEEVSNFLNIYRVRDGFIFVN